MLRQMDMRTVALVLLAAGLLTACGAGDGSDPLGAAAESAQVCDGASEAAKCIEVREPERVEDLQAAFTTGERGGEECPGLDQQVYRIVFSVDGEQRTVDVPAACGPTLTSPSYKVTDEERDLVEDVLNGR